MKKLLKHYMELPYEITVKELRKDESGGIFLTIPLLGAAAVNAHGATYGEARALLENVKEDYFKMWLEEGVPIPEPQDDVEKEYSGKFVLRTRRDLHAQLVNMAKEQNVSLNNKRIVRSFKKRGRFHVERIIFCLFPGRANVHAKRHSI